MGTGFHKQTKLAGKLTEDRIEILVRQEKGRINRAKGVLTQFGLGFLPTWGGGKMPPPNLAFSSQMTMKVGKDILWVEIVTN